MFRTKGLLKAEALQSCKNRGHSMIPWHDYDKHTAYSECRDCQRYVLVNDTPLPNQIDIGGSALALNCNKE